MPWNAGSFTRIHNWSADAASGIDILASRMDQEDDNFRDGISSCLNVSGENTLLEDVSMGGKKWLLCGDALLQNQYPTAGQVQLGKLNYGGESTGSANTYECNVAEGGVIAGLSTWVPGFTVLFMPHQTNDGPATLNVNGTAPAVIICAGFNLQGEEIVDGHICQVVWNGSVWELLSPPQTRLTNAQLFTPIGVKTSLKVTTAGFGTSNFDVLWDDIEWDDAGFGFVPPATGTTFTIPDMPDTPGNEARFNIEFTAVLGIDSAHSTGLGAINANIFLDQGSGFVWSFGGRGTAIIAGSDLSLFQFFIVRASLEIELKTTDQVKFNIDYNQGNTTTLLNLHGESSIVNRTWASITRMG